jgi:cupin 2 domain-containing protein
MPGLFAQIPAALPVELVETLGRSEHLRIERIVSRGHASPAGFWYDQEWSEFVLLVSGRARLAFNDGLPAVDLEPGDWLDIPARQQHRVDWTDPAQDTVWLAVHYRGQEAPGAMPFALWRQDDHGHRFLVGRYPNLDAAEQQRAELTRTLHKQTYWIVAADETQEGT